jgi:hypothetical protein
LTVIEAANDRLLAYLADFGRFAGGKNRLHGRHSFLGTPNSKGFMQFGLTNHTTIPGIAPHPWRTDWIFLKKPRPIQMMSNQGKTSR